MKSHVYYGFAVVWHDKYDMFLLTYLKSDEAVEKKIGKGEERIKIPIAEYIQYKILVANGKNSTVLLYLPKVDGSLFFILN
jgi:hypothetical protein